MPWACSRAGAPSTEYLPSERISPRGALRRFPNDNRVCRLNHCREPHRVGAGQEDARTSHRIELGDEDLIHPPADVFALARAILDEGDIDLGQQVEVLPAPL